MWGLSWVFSNQTFLFKAAPGETPVNGAEPPAHRQEQKEELPSLLSHEHLLRSVPENIIPPLRLLSPEGSITVSEAAGRTQPRAPGYSLRRSQWCHRLDATFKPCLRKPLALAEPEVFCAAAASPAPPQPTSRPPAGARALTAGRSTAPSPRSSLPLSVLSLRSQKSSFPLLPGRRGSGGRAGGASPASLRPDGRTERKHTVTRVARPAHLLTKTRVQGLRALPRAAPSPQ